MRVIQKKGSINLGREGKPRPERDHGEGTELALKVELEESH